MTETALPDALKGLFIPPQPRLLQDIVAAGDNVDQVARLIAADPGTAAAVLKTVNSAAFALRREVSSIRHAVMLLGLVPVRNLVSGLQLRLSVAAAKNKVNLDNFWDTAQDVATLSAAIVRHLNLDLVDEAYTLGLFHNAGVAVLALNDANYLNVHSSGYSDPAGMEAVETAAIQTTHAAVGYRVARVWKLPQRLSDGIGLHHRLDDVLRDASAEETLKTLLAIVKIAEHLAGLYKRLGTASVDHEWQRVMPLVLEQLGMSEVDYEDMRDSIAHAMGVLPA